ncbi:unnamed protein product [Heligmosomoides polygyrus]|uniref:SCP domain-containing protein n=1 Tax=Heligmosomoides polygyrus TaxID=6339 RepID=A0A3P8A9P7_HELPZ|nr:unnamed protein product [Heligmosomoides polygyrus]
MWLHVGNHVAMSRFVVLILAAYAHAQIGDFEGRRNIDCDEQKARYADRRAAVNLHNLYRSSVAKGESTNGQKGLPPAANMRELLYSCKLEEKAERLIATCPEKLTPATFENLEYNVDIVKEDDRHKALKTMMNAETSHLGCAVKKCGHKYYVSCYYGNKTATYGKEIYHKGQPCSECPDGTQCGESDGLCDNLIYSE